MRQEPAPSHFFSYYRKIAFQEITKTVFYTNEENPSNMTSKIKLTKQQFKSISNHVSMDLNYKNAWNIWKLQDNAIKRLPNAAFQLC